MACWAGFCHAQGFVENAGQWAEPFSFKSTGAASQVFVEKNALLFHAWDGESWGNWLEAAHDRTPFNGPEALKHHAYRMRFVGANPQSFTEKTHPSAHYLNYYLGQDPSRWKSGVREYETVTIRELYPNVDLRIKKYGDNIKYDLLVHPGADIKQIRWTYEGIDGIAEKDGQLELQTSLGTVTEMKPVAFQEGPNGRTEVACVYKIRKGTIGFEFPQNYDRTAELVIDPVLIFSTFTGATQDNWGFTATYDSDGNGYAGGIVFGFGYPTVGAFQTGFGGGTIDVSISKFNYNGTSLVYSTYLGGSEIEMPHSMVVDSQDNLVVMGNTGSNNFPVSGYDNSFNGGVAMTVWGGVADYSVGSDIFVTKFNAAGNALVGSTYVGGTANDGLNLSAGLLHNYADEFRGEVIVDNQDNIVVVSSTSSTNFPVVSAFQSGFGGGTTDACVFKLTPTLSALTFSSYFGGSGGDSGYGIQMNSASEFFFCGGTTSANLPVSAGAVKPAYGGAVDGYLARLSSTGGSILACTYIGTPQYNQSYFVQLDTDENVFVMGQSIGGYPIQAGPTGTVFSNAGAGQFVHKMNPALNTTLMSTCFGNSATPVNIVPSAFLVENCNLIYISGWGTSIGGAQISTNGLPTTPNAYKPTTDGKDFYLMVLKENATLVHYATFFGANQSGAQSGEHVDGGTSRFDKDGIVYQAICAGCGASSALPTTPGAHSSTNNSTNCNLAIIKFDVSDYTATISPQVTPQVCLGNNVHFQNLSTGGISYVWHFGDGDSSTSYHTDHIYDAPGIYNVMLVAYQPSYCFPSDTDFATVEVIAPPTAQVDPVTQICPGSDVTLQASGGTSYQWLPGPGLTPNEYAMANPTVNPLETATYTVIVTGQCGSDTTELTVPVIDFSVMASEDDTICSGSSTQLQASGGITYEWTPALGLDNPNSPNPMATPGATTIYSVLVTNVDGCELRDTVRIQVDVFPQTTAGPDHVICEGESVQLQATGGTFFTWVPPTGLNNPNVANPMATPSDTIRYVVTGTNTCGFDTDTIMVYVKEMFPSSGPDTIVCPGTAVQLYAHGGVHYQWSPGAFLDNPNSQFPVARPEYSFTYYVKITDSVGCVAHDTLRLNVFPWQYPSAGPDRYVEFSESTTLYASGGTGSYQWTPPDFLSCTTCPQPTVTPEITTGYVLTLTDSNNCSFHDTVTVFVAGVLYVPNAFTPGDITRLNEYFMSLGRDIEEVEMMIFNRWGELIYSTNDKNDGWDGTYKGKICPLDVYVWKIRYVDTAGRTGNLIGHVTLLR